MTYCLELCLFLLFLQFTLCSQKFSRRDDYKEAESEAKCSNCVLVIHQLKFSAVNISSQIKEQCNRHRDFESCFSLLDHLSEITTANKLKAPASQVCELISFCSPKNVEHSNQNLSELQQEISCSVCEAVLTMASATNGSKKNSHLLLSAICQKAPLIIQESCKMFIYTYAVVIEEGMNSKKNPLDTCKSIRICPLNVNRTSQLRSFTLLSSILANPLDGQDNAQCQACQWVVSAIEAYLAQDTTEIELSRVFATLCTVLPGTYSNVCQNFVLVYMSEVVGYVIDNLTPPFICDQLRLCSSI
jgi:hypothetical protein